LNSILAQVTDATPRPSAVVTMNPSSRLSNVNIAGPHLLFRIPRRHRGQYARTTTP
jgi:hypothetical protein